MLPVCKCCQLPIPMLPIGNWELGLATFAHWQHFIWCACAQPRNRPLRGRREKGRLKESHTFAIFLPAATLSKAVAAVSRAALVKSQLSKINGPLKSYSEVFVGGWEPFAIKIFRKDPRYGFTASTRPMHWSAPMRWRRISHESLLRTASRAVC